MESDRSSCRAIREWSIRKELLDQMAGRAGEHHYAEERYESDEQKSRRIIASALKRLRWARGELARRRKSDPRKVKLAMKLREETTMTLKWVAEELHMGAWTHVSNLLSRERRRKR